MKLLINIGCGFSTGKSWQNFDASPTLRFERIPILGSFYTKNDRRFPKNAKYGNIVKSQLCRTNGADAIFCSHMLEHISLGDMRRALKNIYAMLKPNGIFRLVVPDLEMPAKHYIESIGSSNAANEYLRSLGMGIEQSSGGLMNLIFRLFGHSAHLWMYDHASMKQELENVGFREIRKCSFKDSEILEFSEVEDVERFESTYGYELAMECKK